MAKETGLRAMARDRFDRMVRTDKTEHLDDPDFPASKKLKMVRGLHLLNLLPQPRLLGQLLQVREGGNIPSLYGEACDDLILGGL